MNIHNSVAFQHEMWARTEPKRQLDLVDLIDPKKDEDEKKALGSIQSILDAVRTHLKMDVGFVSEFTDDRRYFRYVSCFYEDPPIRMGGSDPLDDSYCQRVVDGRLPELILDASMIPAAAELPVTSELPVGAHLSVPLILSDGKVFGTFCCFSYGPDLTLNERDLGLLRVFAQLAAGIIEQRVQNSTRRKTLKATILKTLDLEQFHIVYQPIVRICDGKAVGVEALTRFRDADVRSPSDWFDEASEVDLSIELECATIKQALVGLPYLPDEIYLSVNASPKTIFSGQLSKVLENAPAGRIVIELTEHEAVENYRELSGHLDRLRKRARLAIDDVGAGFASMRHVLDLVPDIIKLDCSLTRDIDREPSRAALVQALATFGARLGVTVLAEGVENEDELDELTALGVQTAQGYYFGRPMPLAGARDFLQKLCAAQGINHH